MIAEARAVYTRKSRAVCVHATLLNISCMHAVLLVKQSPLMFTLEEKITQS